MKQRFYWTARLFSTDKIIQSKYFETKEERDSFVLEHNKWKKRGKICAEHLGKHLQEANSQFYATSKTFDI